MDKFPIANVEKRCSVNVTCWVCDAVTTPRHCDLRDCASTSPSSTIYPSSHPKLPFDFVLLSLDLKALLPPILSTRLFGRMPDRPEKQPSKRQRECSLIYLSSPLAWIQARFRLGQLLMTASFIGANLRWHHTLDCECFHLHREVPSFLLIFACPPAFCEP